MGLALAAGLSPATGQVASMPSTGYVDESAFREGLRQRGLSEWLEQYLTDAPAADEIDAQLRRREELLGQAAELPAARRQAAVADASAILSSLIAAQAEHPARLRWQIELARDLLERADPAAFDAPLFYELPGRDRATVNELSTRAVGVLEALRQQIADTWKSVEALDEPTLEGMTAAGSLRQLESLDAQSALLLAWARLHQAVSADLPESKRTEVLSDLLSEATERRGWTSADAGSAGGEAQRCTALVIATLAARGLGRFADADAWARQIIASVQKVDNPPERQRLRKISLLAVLEQIRVMRDGGKLDEALRAIEQARGWAERTRPGDIQAALAVALVHRSVLARARLLSPAPSAEGLASRPVQPGGLLQPAEALAPLQELAGRSPACRDALYASIAGALANESFAAARSPFELQLMGGAAVVDALAGPADRPPAVEQRLSDAIEAMQGAASTLPADASSSIRGELLFLLGRARYLAGRHLEAVVALADLADHFPEHDRAPVAAEQAAAIALESLRQAEGQDSPAVRAAFIRAGRVLQKRLPDSPSSKNLLYFIALALERDGQQAEAAGEFAAVGPEDSNALKACLGRARCLHRALEQVAASRPAASSEMGDLAEKALQAARDADVRARNHSRYQVEDPNGCIAADIAIMLAELLNHPVINKPAEALDALEDFKTRFAGCPGALGAALRARILALRQLKRLLEARQVVERYLETEPESAGPVMAKLFEAMRDEINAATDQGDADSVRNVAIEAAQLSKTLADWCGQRADRVTASDLLAIRFWQGWSLLRAGRPAEALRVYEECGRADADVLPTDSALRIEIRLGRAESLFALERPAEALPIFTEVWTKSPERSPAWWQAFVGSLECHSRLGSDPNEIVQSIRQQRRLSPELGGPRWRRVLEAIEKSNAAPKPNAANRQ